MTTDDLRLPVFEAPKAPPKKISAEAYRDFVEFAWRNLPSRERILERRKREEPRVRFSLVESEGMKS